MDKNLTNNWWVFPGFELELMAIGFDLPVNLAFVPNPKKDKNSPLLYITELYGKVKVVTNDFRVKTYAENLLNYPSDYRFPGSGESGLIGIVVEPQTGDLFLSMIYQEGKFFKSKVIRTKSKDGLKLDSTETIIDGIPSVHAAHQIQAVSIGFDSKLYVNLGDGMGDPNPAQDDFDLRGKILRFNQDGTIPEDNPNPKNPVFAKGFRNPFGAFWRKSDKHLFTTDNGLNDDDRIVKVEAGKNYGWPKTMRQNTLFNWQFTQAPTALAFMENNEFSEQFRDELFISLFGYSYRPGRQIKGKKIVKIKLNDDSTAVKSYDEFVSYIGQGPASPCGLSFGPGGLYFTDLHGEKEKPDQKATGHLFRVKQIENGEK